MEEIEPLARGIYTASSIQDCHKRKKFPNNNEITIGNTDPKHETARIITGVKRRRLLVKVELRL